MPRGAGVGCRHGGSGTPGSREAARVVRERRRDFPAHVEKRQISGRGRALRFLWPGVAGRGGRRLWRAGVAGGRAWRLRRVVLLRSIPPGFYSINGYRSRVLLSFAS